MIDEQRSHVVSGYRFRNKKERDKYIRRREEEGLKAIEVIGSLRSTTIVFEEAPKAELVKAKTGWG